MRRLNDLNRWLSSIGAIPCWYVCSIFSRSRHAAHDLSCMVMRAMLIWQALATPQRARASALEAPSILSCNQSPYIWHQLQVARVFEPELTKGIRLTPFHGLAPPDLGHPGLSWKHSRGGRRRSRHFTNTLCATPMPFRWVALRHCK